MRETMKTQTNSTFRSVILESASRYADKHALSFVGEEGYTYSGVFKRIEAMAAFLEKLGISKDDKVALIGPNSPDWVISYLAVVYLGGTIVPILHDFSPEEVQSILEHSEAKAIITDKKTDSLIENYPANLQYVISLDDYSFLRDTGASISFSEGSKPALKAEIDADDMAAIIYTSGTTGNSKGVMLSHRNIITNAFMGKKLQHIDDSDRFLSILPLAHTYENTVGMVIPLVSGSSIYYLRKPPTAPVLLPALKAVRPTIMLSVPLIIEKIYFNKIKPTFTDKAALRIIYKLPPVRKMLNRIAGKKLMETFGGEIIFFGIGGAKVNPEVERFLFEAKFPYAIGYGLTETAPLLAGMAPDNARLYSTGPACEEVELILNDPDPATGQGEIWARGPNIMKGYYKNPEKTKEVLTEDGWFRTGDLGAVDKDGFVFIKGRLKTVIVGASGENIYPEEIESMINTFKHVVESLVIEKGGKLVAMVHINRDELEEKYRDLRDDLARGVEEKIEEVVRELNHQVNQRLNKFSRINQFVVQPVPFEKTPTRKIKRYLYA